MIFDYLNCCFGILKLFLYKLLYVKRVCFKGIPKMNCNFKIAIKKNSKLLLGKNFRVRNNVSFRAYDESTIEIGNDCFFNDGCSINARKKITIGSNFKAGQNVIIIDNDHDYKNDIDKYICDEIVIGNNVWIGANSIILRGTHIGDNVVIAAGSIVKEDIPNDTIVYQDRKNKMKTK